MKSIVSAVFGLTLILANAGHAKADTYPQLVARLGSAGAFQPTVEQLLLAKLNAFRASKGLPRLAADGNFARAARAHANDMARRNYLGHDSSNGLDFSGRMNALQGGQMQFSTMGENAVMMYPPKSATYIADTMFKSWLNSSPHLQNMMRRDFTRVATGAVVMGGKAYADQIFIGAPKPRQALSRSGQSLVVWH